MAITRPFNLKKWIDEHRHLLKPPVGNQQVWEDGDFIVMIVGGPNARKDYHYNEGPEFYYQLEGDIVLKIVEDEKPVDIHIKEGDVFLLPPCTPHSPQRGANTVGMVIEHKRTANEKDGLLWFCENCGNKLYEEYFPLTNIVTQFPPVFDRFYGSTTYRTCQKCGGVMEPPMKK